jgi:hypothetical protein
LVHIPGPGRSTAGGRGHYLEEEREMEKGQVSHGVTPSTAAGVEQRAAAGGTERR